MNNESRDSFARVTRPTREWKKLLPRPLFFEGDFFVKLQEVCSHE